MGCFEKLVKSKFLANVSSELRLARQAVLSVTNTNLTPTIYGSKKDRKSLYDDYVYYFYLLEEIVDSLEEPDCVKTMIYYIKYDTVMFIYSMDKGQVEDAIRYNYNLNGDIPLYKTKHRLKNKTVYTVLIDTRIRFEPISPN
jgi:hypothetical protein